MNLKTNPLDQFLAIDILWPYLAIPIILVVYYLVRWILYMRAPLVEQRAQVKDLDRRMRIGWFTFFGDNELRCNYYIIFSFENGQTASFRVDERHFLNTAVGEAGKVFSKGNRLEGFIKDTNDAPLKTPIIFDAPSTRE
jgi:hypothetical protein